MKITFYKIVILAMIADGIIQDEERLMVMQLEKSHPQFRDLTAAEAKQAQVDVYNQISVGMEPKHIVEQIGSELSSVQKHTAFALAKEVCAADFNVFPAETDFLKLLEEMWSIPSEVVASVDASLALRYSI